jgi:hypothetical protein
MYGVRCITVLLAGESPIYRHIWCACTVLVDPKYVVQLTLLGQLGSALQYYTVLLLRARCDCHKQV